MATRTLFPTTGTQASDIAAGYIQNGVYAPRTLPGAVNPPEIPGSIRNLQDPSSPVPPGGSGTQSDPNQAFGLALMQLLQKHQQLGTAPFVNQGLNASDTAANASTNAALNPALQGYAPGVIQGAASNASAPYNPIIQGAQRGQQTMEEQIRALGSGITAAQSFLKTNIDAENKARDDARTLIHQSFADFGGGAFDQLNPKDQADLEKKAGLPAGYIHGVGKTIKERELALKDAVANAGNADQTDLAQQLVDGTMDPSQLSKRTKNYNAVLAEANKLSLAQTGKAFNIAQATIDYKFANQPNTQNTLNYLVSLTGGPGQTGNLDELINISNSISRTNFPALNKVSNWAKLQAGNPQIAAYYAVATEVADQVAKILQGGGTGSGTSDAKLKQAVDLFQSDFSKAQLLAITQALKPLLNNRARSMIGNNRYLKASYGDRLDLGGGSNTGTTVLFGPDGKQYNVPNANVDAFIKAGGHR